MTFLAAIVADDYGDRALALLTREGVDTSLVRRIAGVSTGVGFIVVDDDGNNAIAVDLGANRFLSPDDVDRAEHAIAGADVVVAQLEIPPETALRAVAVGRAHGVRTILNPAPAQALPAGGLTHVDYLTPKVTEAQVLAGSDSSDACDLAGALRKMGARTVILTMGEQGAWIVAEQDARISAKHETRISGKQVAQLVPAYPVAAVDTTGAGDAFSAALAVGLAEGRTVDGAVHFACAAGGYSVQSLGTVPSYATRPELEDFIERHATPAG